MPSSGKGCVGPYFGTKAVAETAANGDCRNNPKLFEPHQKATIVSARRVKLSQENALVHLVRSNCLLRLTRLSPATLLRHLSRFHFLINRL